MEKERYKCTHRFSAPNLSCKFCRRQRFAAHFISSQFICYIYPSIHPFTKAFAILCNGYVSIMYLKIIEGWQLAEFPRMNSYCRDICICRKTTHTIESTANKKYFEWEKGKDRWENGQYKNGFHKILNFHISSKRTIYICVCVWTKCWNVIFPF